LKKLVVLCEKAEKENKIIRCRKLTVKLAENISFQVFILPPY